MDLLTLLISLQRCSPRMKTRLSNASIYCIWQKDRNFWKIYYKGRSRIFRSKWLSDNNMAAPEMLWGSKVCRKRRRSSSLPSKEEIYWKCQIKPRYRTECLHVSGCMWDLSHKVWLAMIGKHWLWLTILWGLGCCWQCYGGLNRYWMWLTIYEGNDGGLQWYGGTECGWRCYKALNVASNVMDTLKLACNVMETLTVAGNIMRNWLWLAMSWQFFCLW